MAFCLFGVLHEGCVMPLLSRDVGRDRSGPMSGLAGVPAISNGGYLGTVHWGKARRAKGGKA